MDFICHLRVNVMGVGYAVVVAPLGHQRPFKTLNLSLVQLLMTIQLLHPNLKKLSISMNAFTNAELFLSLL